MRFVCGNCKLIGRLIDTCRGSPNGLQTKPAGSQYRGDLAYRPVVRASRFHGAFTPLGFVVSAALASVDKRANTAFSMTLAALLEMGLK